MTLLYGAESSGKTLLASCLVREFQNRWPDYKCVLIEPEGTYDTEFAERCGVDVKNLTILKPDYCEQASDLLYSFLSADDCGLVVLDSIASLSGMAEIAKSAEDVIVAGSSQTVNRMLRKASVALRVAERGGRPTTFLAINQPRMKAGVVFGNPETLPGGQQQHFACSLKVRIRGAGEKVISETGRSEPALIDVDGTIMKHKVRIATKKFKYSMVLFEHSGMKAGRCSDFGTFKEYASDLGLMVKSKNGWELADPDTGSVETFPRQTDLWDSLLSNSTKLDVYRQAILKALLP
jgi:recombination protein RecA